LKGKGGGEIFPLGVECYICQFFCWIDVIVFGCPLIRDDFLEVVGDGRNLFIARVSLSISVVVCVMSLPFLWVCSNFAEHGSWRMCAPLSLVWAFGISETSPLL